MLFLVIIMVGTSFSVIFYGFSSPSSKQKQYGYSFVNNGQAWIAKISGKQAMFSYLPEEAKKINVQGVLPDLKNRVEIDTTSDFNDKFNQSIALAQHQMNIVLNQNYNVYIVPGFTSNNTYGLPVITCAGATPPVPVVFFMGSNETSLSADGNCIIAEASSDADIIKIKDLIVYSVLGVLDV